MHWIAPSEKDDAKGTLENRLWQAAAGNSPSPPLEERVGERRPKDYSGDPARELSVHGVEKTDETGRLCRTNLAVHGLEGDIRHGFAPNVASSACSIPNTQLTTE